MRPIYLEPTTKEIENSEYRRTNTGRGCDGTTNHGGTQKPDNPLKGIWNSIPLKPDNPLKGIHNIVPNGMQRQWQRGITVPT